MKIFLTPNAKGLHDPVSECKKSCKRNLFISSYFSVLYLEFNFVGVGQRLETSAVQSNGELDVFSILYQLPHLSQLGNYQRGICSGFVPLSGLR